MEVGGAGENCRVRQLHICTAHRISSGAARGTTGVGLGGGRNT